jgi:DNA adenine methylase
MIAGLSILNEKQIPFILSYDGSCGERNYGEPLPEAVAHRILLDVGRSSQATLSGRNEITVESLYVSHEISAKGDAVTQSLRDFDNRQQASLFA